MYKLCGRHLIASGSFICMIDVNDTLPPDFLWNFFGLDENDDIFQGKLFI